MNAGQFERLMAFPVAFSRVWMDAYNEIIVGQIDTESAVFMTLDMKVIDELPWISDIQKATYHDDWHVSTHSEGYDWNGRSWKKNMRFTDWRDIDHRWRIGVISRSDTERQ